MHRSWSSLSLVLLFLAALAAVRRATAAVSCPESCHQVRCTCTEEAGGLIVTCEELNGPFVGCLDDSVTEFYMHNSLLASIVPAEFENATNLTRLDITNNSPLFSIANGTFSGLPRLAHVFLSYNSISSLPVDLFNGSENVLALSVDHNVLANFVCPTLPHLESLDLSENRITSLYSNSFESCQSLKSINLTANDLTAFQQIIAHLSNLLELDLSYNKVTHSDFSLLPNLTRLYLPFNDIVSLPALPTGLKVLDLRGNLIGTIGENYFEKVAQLTFLDLSEMVYLTSIGDKAFAKLSSLVGIVLSNNKQLDSLPADVWPDSFGLTFVDLANCDINVFHPGLFEDFSELVFVNIADNPVRCDCGATWMRNFMDESRYAGWIDAWKNGPETVVCESPENVRGIPVSQLNSYDLTCEHSQIASHSTFSTSDSTIFEVELINGLPNTSWYLPNGQHIRPDRQQSTAVTKRNEEDEDIVVEEILSQNMVIVARLTIKPSTDEDYGIYVVEWTNAGGSDNFTFTLEHDPTKKRLSSSDVAAIVLCVAMVAILSVVGVYLYRYVTSRRRPYGRFTVNDDGGPDDSDVARASPAGAAAAAELPDDAAAAAGDDRGRATNVDNEPESSSILKSTAVGSRYGTLDDGLQNNPFAAHD